MPNIFMSYARGDKPRVKPLTEVLRCTGVIEPWFDGYLVAGADWKVHIAAAISRCDTFLYCLSPESVNSHWCLWELNQAIDLHKPIMPVLLDADVKMSPLLEEQLSHIQWVDYSEGPTPDAVAKLVAGLLRPTYDVNAPRGRFDVLNPVGPPPQAPPSPPANGAHADPEQLAYERMWREQREELANMLARQMLELQDYGAWMRFDKFMIYSERDRRRFEWAYVGRVDPSPYEEFVRFEDEPSDEPRRISEAELRIWLAQFRQAAYEEAAGPIVRSISQKLVERGWDSETMTKRWAGGDSMAFVKAIAYELIDTQKDVFHICLGEVEVWRTRGSVYVVG